MRDSALGWQLLSALGDSKLLVPATLIIMLFAARSAWRPVLIWGLAVSVVGIVALGSKLAFLGWGVGWEKIDFTGFSGHAMAAAAIYPVLGYAIGRVYARYYAWGLSGIGAGLAMLIAFSRVRVVAHSLSEVVLGFLLGIVAAVFVLRLRHTQLLKVQIRQVVVGFSLAALVSYGVLPHVRAHDGVLALAQALCGPHRLHVRPHAL